MKCNPISANRCANSMKKTARGMGCLFLGLLPCIHPCLAACTVSVSQAVAFGSYNPFGLTAVDTTGTINLSCSGLVSLYLYDISLNQGSWGTFSQRNMANGSNRLGYNLYTNTARTTVWGDGTSGTSTQGGTCLIVLGSCSVNLTVYARLPASQNVATGSYADSVTVTVNY